MELRLKIENNPMYLVSNLWNIYSYYSNKILKKADDLFGNMIK